MYDSRTGRWTSEDPLGFAAADTNLYRYVGNQPANALDPRGLETTANFENSVPGIAAALKDGTLQPVPGVDGKTFSQTLVNEHGAIKISFTFKKAYVGTWINKTLAGDIHLVGAYVDIQFSEEGCWKFSAIKLLQVDRDYNAFGTSIHPFNYTWTNMYRRGFDDPKNSPSMGWQIDARDEDTDPFYTKPSGEFGNIGAGAAPAELWDAPGQPERNAWRGKEFITSAIGFKDGRGYFLGSVRWGYFVGADAKDIRFRPLPEVSLGAPQEVIDSVNRWNSLSLWGGDHIDVAGL